MIQCQGVEKRFSTPLQSTPLYWSLGELSIEKGERVLVTGPSGCGKSTLVNLLSGLLTADRGSITVDSVRVDQLSVTEADIYRGQHLGLVFQSFQLLNPLTLLDNILLGARYGRKWSPAEAHAKAQSLIAQVGLYDRQRHRPNKLSIGEQQRVAIARALINEPTVLLADEPTASLDQRNSDKVLDLLFDLCQKHGTTMVVVSHDTTIADRFDRAIDASKWMSASEQEVSHV